MTPQVYVFVSVHVPESCLFPTLLCVSLSDLVGPYVCVWLWVCHTYLRKHVWVGAHVCVCDQAPVWDCCSMYG